MKNQREIKAVSFDVWNTLIKPNPKFSEARLEFLSGYLQVSQETIREKYTEVKRFIDKTAEEYGMSFSNIQCWQMLFAKTNGNEVLFMDCETIIHFMEQTFLLYPPEVNPETVSLVKELARQGIYVGFASNSNFISGKFMLPYLNNIFGESDFGLFSDLGPFAKPHPKFFGNISGDLGIKPEHILHVGDNEICDGFADIYGFHTCLVNFDNVGKKVREYLL